MKQRLLSVFAMLSLMISGVMAQTFTISTDCEGYFIAGDRVEVSINVEGAQEMTALQFNFSLPEGFTLSEGWPIYMGNATNGHAMNASILDSGDLFVVLYSLHSGTFDDGTLISFNVTAAEDAVSTQGKLYNVRTATTDAVSHTLSDVTFAMNIASEEPEPTWHLSGPATEEEVTTQSYIDGLVYNQTTKPSTITLKKGYNVIIIPSSWTTPTFGLVSDFSKRYEPFTANDLGITNPSNKNVLVLYSGVENATCYVKWGTNVVPEPEPEAKYYWYVGTTDPATMTSISPIISEDAAPYVYGWTEITETPTVIKVFKESSNWQETGDFPEVQWYIACPAEYGFSTSVNGVAVGGWTKSQTTINGVLYDVWKCKSLADTVNTQLAKVENTTPEPEPEPDPEPTPETSYYWYLGTEKLLTDEEVEAKGVQISDESEISTLTWESAEYVYFIYPKEFGKAVIVDDGGDEAPGKAVEALSNVNLEKYTGWRFNKDSQGIEFSISFTEPEYTVSLDQTNVTLAVGESVTLTATVTPEGATTESMWWQVYDTNIATVENGVVTAVSEGSTRIIVHVGDYFAACQVTVEAAAVEPEPEGLLTGKNYRVKNVTTGLYLQVEGNNTNMKLQNKAEGVVLTQVFQLEEVAEGMYYIKAADSDNNYYAHASGWNFNATTNADNKTPFTIALVEGETEVYTLHQSVSAHTGLAGTDDAAAGAAIYCDKNVDNNGKWAFEPLTEEENAAYVTTLTATAKAALDAAIARGEEVVATRSAVLTAEEVAAINDAVQTAKEGKDAATEVAALKALSDAIHTAVDAAIYVWSIDELSNEVCYAVSTEDRGAWYAQATHLTSTAKAGVAVDVTDKQQFAFVQSPEIGALYLYSVSEEKFVKAEGGYTALTEAPAQTISILNGTRSAAFPWVVALNAEDGQKQMGISNGYDPAVITHYNDLGDGGNTVRIEKAATFDATAALAAIKALETGVEKTAVNGGQTTIIYDLTGRCVEKATKGIYIVNGKKVIVK